MTLLINMPGRDTDRLVARLSKDIDESEVVIWPNVKEPNDVTMALTWLHEHGSLSDLPNLKGISSFGAGVDSIVEDKSLPDVPVARIVDPDLSLNMANYVLTMINNHKLRFNMYQQQQSLSLWKPRSVRKGNKVGVLGLGELGLFVGEFLSKAGFEVHGWSQSRKSSDNIKSLTGEDGFNKIVSEVDYLVCLLPLTVDTKYILDKHVFNNMKTNAVLINVARGQHIIEQDLIAALYDKSIAGAILDVFAEEPLPESHPYWRTPNLTLTPHVSAVTNIETASQQVIENYQRLKEGKAMINTIDKAKGY